MSTNTAPAQVIRSKNREKPPQFTMYLSIFFDRILLSVLMQKLYALKNCLWMELN